MGVPEQLRRLDEDLATGRVDAESYRRRRDELLAARLPAPPPPAPADDLDDSELDAADRELGLEDDGAADPLPARPPRRPTPGTAYAARRRLPRARTGRGRRRAPGPVLRRSPSPAPRAPPPTPPPGTPPFSRRPPPAGPSHPGGPAIPPTTPAGPGAARGPRAASPPPAPARSGGPRASPRRPGGRFRGRPSGTALRRGRVGRHPRDDDAGACRHAPAVRDDRPADDRARPPGGRGAPRSAGDRVARGRPRPGRRPAAADGDPAETPGRDRVLGTRCAQGRPGTREPAAPAETTPETVSSGHGREGRRQERGNRRAARFETVSPGQRCVGAARRRPRADRGTRARRRGRPPRHPRPGPVRRRPAAAGHAGGARVAPATPARRRDEHDADDATRTDERPLPADPFPPPFRWSTEGTDDRDTSPDTTQVVRDAAGPAADRTQVVTRGAPEPEVTQVVRRSSVPPRGAPPRAAPPAPERTQFVPGSVPARSAGGGVARPEETVPPWAAGAARSEGLPGRELFARGPGPRAGAILGAAAVVLLVLVVLVASIALA